MNTPSAEYRKFTREAKAQLIEAYRYSRDHGNTPAETAQLLIDAIGAESAAEIVAVMVLCKGEWDARICPRNREWARETAEHDEAELAQIPGLYYCDEIHPANMDLLANVFRRASATR